MVDVMTVSGPVPSDRLAVTLPHEHLIIDLARVTRNYDHFLHDVDLATKEARRFKDAGGSTIVELTNRNLGRDPAALLRISRDSGVNIVMGCGWYREPYYEAEVYERSTNELAADIISEISYGVGGTGIRPGIIGEIGSDDRKRISPAEERSFRAAARAHRKTGLTISTHAAFSRIGLEQLDLLQEEAVDLRRVVVGHAGHMSDPDYHEELARRGAWVAFDRIRGPYEWEIQRYIHLVVELRRRGYLTHLLLSHDVCMLPHLHEFGGTGYDFIPSNFASRLRQAGLSEEELHMLVVENPRSALIGR